MIYILKTIFCAYFFFRLYVPDVHGQSVYAGTIDYRPKSKNSFVLTNRSEKTVGVAVGKQKWEFTFDEAADQTLILELLKRRAYSLTGNNFRTDIQVQFRKMTINAGTTYLFNKRTDRKLIIADESGRVVLEADCRLRGSKATVNIVVNESKYDRELFAYAAYYVYMSGRRMRESTDWVPVGAF